MNAFDLSLLVNLLLVLASFIIGGFIIQSRNSKVLQADNEKLFPIDLSAAKLPAGNNHEHLKVEEVLSRIEILGDQELSLSGLSQSTGISKHRLTLIFRTHYKKSFYQVLADRRIALARKLLLTSPEIKIDTLSITCGFGSKAAFNRHFLLITGVTPKEYRNRLAAGTGVS